jgi:hypothetical protein
MNLTKARHMGICLAASCLLLAGLFLFLNGAPQTARANPGDLFVMTGGSGSVCTQADPCDLATALNQSAGGDTIYLAQGTYTGAGEEVVLLTKGISLYGGWDASLTTPPVRNPQLYPTILDGENARRGVSISGNITPTLDGFIVTRGNASSAALDPGRGGGIYSSGANPILTNNVITDNIASTSPSSWAYGGGVSIQDSPIRAEISGNLIANNTASKAYTGQGGGLEVRDTGYVLISKNVFRGNIASTTLNGLGGGLYLQNSPANVSGNSIQDNQATPTGDGFGGGIYSESGEVTFSGNLVTGNTAQYGAVTFEHNGSLTLSNNIIAQNPAGGVFVRGNASSPVEGTLANNTIAQNGKEGVYAGWFSSGYSTLTLTNNIIVSQTTGIYAYPSLNPNVVTATHTLFYGNNQDTGGTTITSTDEITGDNPLFVDPAALDYHLGARSPAIDTGLTIPWLTTDIDGDPRPWPVGGSYDLGADEAQWWRIYLPPIFKGY